MTIPTLPYDNEKDNVEEAECVSFKEEAKCLTDDSTDDPNKLVSSDQSQ